MPARGAAERNESIFMQTGIRKLTLSALLCALSIVLVLLIHFPIFPVVYYLEYDPGDIPILLGTMLLGPFWGVGITIVTVLVQGLTVSSASGVYGIIMHFISTGCLVAFSYVGIALCKKKLGDTASRAVGLLAGALLASGVMLLANLLVTPAFTGMPVAAIRELLLPFILPFNLIKLVPNALLAFLLHKLLQRYVIRNAELA